MTLKADVVVGITLPRASMQEADLAVALALTRTISMVVIADFLEVSSSLTTGMSGKDTLSKGSRGVVGASPLLPGGQ